MAIGDGRKRKAILMACTACKLAIVGVTEFLQSEDDASASSSSSSQTLQSMLHLLQTLVASAAAAAAAMEFDSKRRRLTHEWWVKPRSAGWANRLFAGLVDVSTHRTLFRMSPATLEWLCLQVAPLVERMDTHYRQSVPVKKRVAMALYRLSTGAKYSEVAEKFGLGESTAFICTKQLCDALCSRFKHFLNFPQPTRLQRVILGFEQMIGLPNCCGAIDCLRFKIRRPAGPYSGDYYDGNLDHSVIAQIVVDCNSRILNIAAGFAGGTSDARVLRLSAFYDDVQSQKLLNGPPVQLGGVEIPQYLVGDAGYPFLPWLLLPYQDFNGALHPHEMTFNYKHALIRRSVLRAFASLRKWQIFRRAMSVDVKTAVAMIGACSILHNMLLYRGEPLDLEEDQHQDFRMYDEPPQYEKNYVSEDDGFSENNVLAFHVRDALAMLIDQSGSS